jgi:type IV fimbrial biogenesis protein FimT/type IV fimbrial biogenesis protein FimU
MKNRHYSNYKKNKARGFTLLELMVGIVIVGILIGVGLPSLNDFMTRSRVDAQITEIHRVVMTARNAAINTGQWVTVCPLASNACGTNWQGQISVFTNTNNTPVDAVAFNAADTEILLKTKDAASAGDTIVFNQGNSLIFSPTGRLASAGPARLSFCPADDANLSRGVEVSLTGRVYTTSDTDNDDKDEFRNNTEVSCS